ncbi:MAG: hypothetical protein IAE78_06080 [Myxococcus sp.]|nr:hypothetical protein [Myxococcus sp.]
MYRIFLVAAVCSLGACTCAPRLETQRLELPPDVVPVLTAGLSFPSFNTEVLAPIRPGANTSVIFSQEFEKAPGMTALSLNAESVAAIESRLPDTVRVPPLERDLASCQAQDLSDGGTAPFPTQPFHESPPILFFNPDAGALPFTTSPNSPAALVRLDHVRGVLSAISLLPESPDSGITQLLVDRRVGVTSFQFAATIENLDLKVSIAGAPATVNVATVAVSCRGVISPATVNVPNHYRSCGEQNVACLAPTVTLSGLTTNLTFPFIHQVLESTMHDSLVEVLRQGVNLHFQNFAPTSLTFLPAADGAQKLEMTGSSTVVNGWSACSPVAPPEPAAGPTRALGRPSATWGVVMQTSTRGRVRFGDLIPEANMALTSNHSGTFALFDRTELPRGLTVGFVEALPLDEPFLTAEGVARFSPRGIETSLRTVQRFPRKCWVEPVTVETFDILREGRALSHWARADERSLSQELDGLSELSMGLMSLEEVDFEGELMPLLKEAGLEGEFGDARWTRLKLGVAPPHDGPLPWPAPPTGELHIYSDLPYRELAERFGPQLECGRDLQEPVASEARVSDPEVDFGPFKVDSVDIPSDALSVTARGTSFVRRSRGDHVVISLPASCPAVEPGKPFNPCWTETMAQLPKVGSIAVTKGFSGTTQRTGSLRTETPEALGDRTAAIHGVFDRSGVAVYTKVPDDYRPFTSKTFDYRGSITLEWDHGPNFQAPPRHFHAPGYAPAPRRFFTNWLWERFELRHVGQWPPSNCLLPQMRFAVPTQLEVNEYVPGSRTSLARQSVRIPGQLSIGSAGAFGDYRVSPGVSRSFATVSIYP